MSISDHWRNLNPKVRRVLAVGGGILGIWAIAWVVMPEDTVRRGGKKAATVETVLLDKNTRDVTLGDMAARIGKLEDEAAKKDAQIDRLKEDVARKERGPSSASGDDGKRQALEMQVAALEKRVGQLQQERANPPKDGASPAQGGASGGKAQLPVPNDLAPQRPGMTPISKTSPPTTGEFYGGKGGGSTGGDTGRQGEAAGAREEATSTAANASKQEIRVITQEPDKDEEGDEDGDGEVAERYLPPASVFSGTLITGLDAPTGTGARQQPFPVLLRIKHDALLPNRWKADVKECHLLAGGFGDMSSERVIVRGETISCVTKQGKVLEAAFPAYAVGEDGKNGIRGRMVSKQGQLIGRALMAGFLDGISKAFDVKPVPVLATSNTGRSQYADVFAGEQSLRAAAFGGASSALDKIAQFYIDMAANVFPVIEVDSGRKIDFVSLRGINLTFHRKGKSQALRDMRLPGTGAGTEESLGSAAASAMSGFSGLLGGAGNAAGAAGGAAAGMPIPSLAGRGARR